MRDPEAGHKLGVRSKLAILRMKKLVLLSMIIAMIAIPARAARMKDSRAGLKQTLIRMAIYDVIYLLLLLYVFPRLN